MHFACEAHRSKDHVINVKASLCPYVFCVSCPIRPWDSEEGHLKGFRSSPEFKLFFASVQPYVKDIEEMRHYQVISTGGKAR